MTKKKYTFIDIDFSNQSENNRFLLVKWPKEMKLIAHLIYNKSLNQFIKDVVAEKLLNDKVAYKTRDNKLRVYSSRFKALKEALN